MKLFVADAEFVTMAVLESTFVHVRVLVFTVILFPVTGVFVRVMVNVTRSAAVNIAALASPITVEISRVFIIFIKWCIVHLGK